MSSQLWRTLQIKGHDQNYMITKFDNDTIIRFAARHDSFGLNFTRKNRKSEKNPAFRKSELGILPLRAHNIRVYGSRSTYQNGSLEKKFFRAKNFFRAIFRKKFFFDFLTMMGIKTLLSLSWFSLNTRRKFRAIFRYILAYEVDLKMAQKSYD